MTSNVLVLTVSDVLLRMVLAGGKPSAFTVVQIGANDGMTHDPIHRLMMKHGFRGVLVEPQPEAFARLQQNYAGREGIAFERAAIAEQERELPLYRFKPGPGVPDWAGSLASFSRATLVGNFHNVKGEVETIMVPTLTFSGLLRRHGLERVDLLQIDTEGFDDRIIATIDFGAVKPTIIAFEHGFLSASRREQCFRLLQRHGYKITNNGTDTVAYQEPPEQSLVNTHVWVD